MQKGSTFAVAWAVLASACALPQSVKADTALTPVPVLEGPIDTNPLKLDGAMLMFDVSQLPIPGQQKVGVDLQTITGKIGDLGVKAQTSNLNVGPAKFSLGASGTLGAVEEDIGSLNLSLNLEGKIADGTAALTLNSSVGALEDGNLEAMGLSFGWASPTQDGVSLNVAGSGTLAGSGLARVGVTINLHPEAPAAPAQPLDLDWNQWERSGGQTNGLNGWGLDGWEGR